MKMLAGLLAGCLLWGASAMMVQATQAAKEPKQRVLRHVVLYKFKPEVNKTQLQEVIDAFAALPAKIDAIVDFEHGENVSREGKSEGFTHCFTVSFRDEAGRDAYLKHPAHQAYVDVVRDRREKVIVFDYWTHR